MSVALPNGIILALATTFGSPLSVTVASNDDPCELTVTNTLTNGDFVEFTSGWANANNRVFRVANRSGTTLELEGFDTSNTTRFPAGSGVGTIRKITNWQQIQQVTETSSSGGDPQFVTYSFLEQDFDSQLPSTTSAQSIALTIADDPTLLGYIAMKEAAEERALRPLRATLPQGGVILYNGYVSFDETPSMTKGQLMACKGSFALQGRPVRYAT